MGECTRQPDREAPSPHPPQRRQPRLDVEQQSGSADGDADEEHREDLEGAAGRQEIGVPEERAARLEAEELRPAGVAQRRKRQRIGCEAGCDQHVPGGADQRSARIESAVRDRDQQLQPDRRQHQRRGRAKQAAAREMPQRHQQESDQRVEDEDVPFPHVEVHRPDREQDRKPPAEQRQRAIAAPFGGGELQREADAEQQREQRVELAVAEPHDQAGHRQVDAGGRRPSDVLRRHEREAGEGREVEQKDRAERNAAERVDRVDAVAFAGRCGRKCGHGATGRGSSAAAAEASRRFRHARERRRGCAAHRGRPSRRRARHHGCRRPTPCSATSRCGRCSP